MNIIESLANELVYVTFRGRTTTWGLPGARVEQVASEHETDVERVVDLAMPLDLDADLPPRRTLVLSWHRRRIGLGVYGPLEVQSVERDQLQPVPLLLRSHGAASLVRHVVLGAGGPSFLGLDADLLCALGDHGVRSTEGDVGPA